MVELFVKVVPKSNRTELAGWEGDRLKIRLAIVPEKGKANVELCRFLAETFGVPRSAVTIVSGETSRLKRILIDGGDLSQIPPM